MRGWKAKVDYWVSERIAERKCFSAREVHSELGVSEVTADRFLLQRLQDNQFPPYPSWAFGSGEVQMGGLVTGVVVEVGNSGDHLMVYGPRGEDCARHAKTWLCVGSTVIEGESEEVVELPKKKVLDEGVFLLKVGKNGRIVVPKRILQPWFDRLGGFKQSLWLSQDRGNLLLSPYEVVDSKRYSISQKRFRLDFPDPMKRKSVKVKASVVHGKIEIQLRTIEE